MKVKGSELIFISLIHANGLGVTVMDNTELVLPNQRWYNEEFELKRLSLTHDTYIAHNMSTYVVKLKPKTMGGCFDEEATKGFDKHINTPSK